MKYPEIDMAREKALVACKAEGIVLDEEDLMRFEKLCAERLTEPPHGLKRIWMRLNGLKTIAVLRVKRQLQRK